MEFTRFQGIRKSDMGTVLTSFAKDGCRTFTAHFGKSPKAYRTRL